MTDERRHRGPHPDDPKLFSQAHLPALRRAVADLAWLLTCGYGQKAAIKLVGDRYNLAQRQRVAVQRAACADPERAARRASRRPMHAIENRHLVIDGYNVLTTVEVATAGGVLLRCRDPCLRDLASMHGSFRQVAETGQAIDAIGQRLAGYQPPRVT